MIRPVRAWRILRARRRGRVERARQQRAAGTALVDTIEQRRRDNTRPVFTHYEPAPTDKTIRHVTPWKETSMTSIDRESSRVYEDHTGTELTVRSTPYMIEIGIHIPDTNRSGRFAMDFYNRDGILRIAEDLGAVVSHDGVDRTDDRYSDNSGNVLDIHTNREQAIISITSVHGGEVLFLAPPIGKRAHAEGHPFIGIRSDLMAAYRAMPAADADKTTSN